MTDCPVHHLAADLTLVADDRILFARHREPDAPDKPGPWRLPGVALRHFEAPEAAVARILKEGLGLAALPSFLSHVESFEAEDGRWHLVFHFAAQAAHRPEVKPGRDMAGARWFPLSELPAPEELARECHSLETIREILYRASQA